jgi:hypothetical protein
LCSASPSCQTIVIAVVRSAYVGGGVDQVVIVANLGALQILP